MDAEGNSVMDGIFVIGATNHPERLDPALLRVGRLGIRYYIGPPSLDQRLQILKVRNLEFRFRFYCYKYLNHC